MNKLIMTGFWLLWCSLTQAEPPTIEEEDTINEVRWYQVELMIFTQQPTGSEIPETWSKDIILSYPENWNLLKTPAEYLDAYQKNPTSGTPFILLDKKQHRLGGIEKKLLLNRNRILFHETWRQSLKQDLQQKNADFSTPILIRAGNQYDDHYELEGSITLKLQRYLHFSTDLWLSHFVKKTDAVVTDKKIELSTETNWPELPSFPASIKTTDAAPVDDVMQVAQYDVDMISVNKQSRRMRSYEVHYIDHPKMGIVVNLTPLDDKTLLPIPQKN